MQEVTKRIPVTVTFYKMSLTDDKSVLCKLGLLLSGKSSRYTHVGLMVGQPYRIATHLTYGGVQNFDLTDASDLDVWFGWKPDATVELMLTEAQVEQLIDDITYHEQANSKLSIGTFLRIAAHRPRHNDLTCVTYITDLLGVTVLSDTTPDKFLEVLTNGRFSRALTLSKVFERG